MKLYETFKDKKLFKLMLQFFKFGLIGVSNAIISLGIYFIFIFINKDLYLIGNVVGYIVAVFNSFLLNRKFVFSKNQNKGVGKTVIKVYISYGITLLLQELLLYLMINIFTINEHIAPLINIIVTTPINFVLNKSWAFGDKDLKKLSDIKEGENR